MAPIKSRSHVDVCKWVQKYADCADRFLTDRRLVSTIFVDETLLQIYSLMGCDFSDAVKVWFPSPEIVKDLSKKKNRQKEYKITLPSREPQNYVIRGVSHVSNYIVFEPLGEVSDVNGMSDPYMGV